MKITSIKQFTNGWVAVLKLSDGKLIETTSTCLPKSTEIRLTGNHDNMVELNSFNSNHWKEKYMIGISTQSGCPVKCKFCAVNKLTSIQGFRNLTAEEMFQQVQVAIETTKSITRLNIDPNDADIFRVLFTRMGEPSLNVDNVIKAIEMIKDCYPHARIQISTIGLKRSETLVNRLIDLEKRYEGDWLELQFSIHSTDNDFRKWLQTDTIMCNNDVGQLASMFYNSKSNRGWKVTLNFALSDKTIFKPKDLAKDFNPEHCFIKISPINENQTSDDNNLHTMFTYENNI